MRSKSQAVKHRGCRCQRRISGCHLDQRWNSSSNFISPRVTRSPHTAHVSPTLGLQNMRLGLVVGSLSFRIASRAYVGGLARRAWQRSLVSGGRHASCRSSASYFTAFVLPRRKALGVKWNQMFSVVLESDLHCHLVPAQCVAAHAAGFAVSRPKPCCADRPASGQLAAMNGVSRVLSEHSFFQHVFSKRSSRLNHLRAMSVSLIARATAIGVNTGATRGQDSYDYGR